MLQQVDRLDSSVFDDDGPGGDGFLLSQILRARATEFVERQGWPLQVQDLEERDEFDGSGVVYFAATEKGEHVASLRLMPSEAPNVSAKLFAESSALISAESKRTWEVSRFFAVSCRYFGALRSVMRAGHDFLRARGAQAAIGVTSPRMQRIITRLGWSSTMMDLRQSSDGDVLLCRWQVGTDAMRITSNDQRRYSVAVIGGSLIRPPSMDLSRV